MLPDFAAGDAIGNEVLALQKTLRSWGVRSEIFASHVQARLRGQARPVEDYARRAVSDDVLIFHFSIGHRLADELPGLPGRKVLRYHNITPAHFLEGVYPDGAERCRLGRQQLPRLAGAVALGLGVSAFNCAELVEAGCAAVEEVPILLDLAVLETPPDPRLLARYGDGRPTVLHVGRLVPNKRIEDLVKAHYWLTRAVPRARLLLVGGGETNPYARGVRKLIRELRVPGVYFSGHVTNAALTAFYRSAGVYLCLSEHEGFCVPLVEAMHFGLPIVARAAAGVPGTLGAGGILLSRPDPVLTGEVLARVLGDGALRTELGERSRARLGAFQPAVVRETLRQVLASRLGLDLGCGEGMNLAMVSHRKARRLFPVLCLLLVTVAALLLPAAASAQEKKVSLVFTGELLSQIATDNQGERTAEIVNRIIGLSPTVLSVRLQRAGGRVSLYLGTGGVDELPVSFQFTIDKMVYYRMRTSSADITGMTEALQQAKAAEPLLREVGYRYDGRYSMIDLTLDLRPAIKAAREEQARREAEARAAAAKGAPRRPGSGRPGDSAARGPARSDGGPDHPRRRRGRAREEEAPAARVGAARRFRRRGRDARGRGGARGARGDGARRASRAAVPHLLGPGARRATAHDQHGLSRRGRRNTARRRRRRRGARLSPGQSFPRSFSTMRRSSRTTSPNATERAVAEPAAVPPALDGPFTALDFETADYGADSACALALVHVEGLEIVGRDLFMIRPPRSRFAFTHIHGITWAHVRAEPSFAEHWPEIAAKLARATFLAAHNASFDRGVLAACCGAAGVPPPELQFSLHGAARPANLAAPGIGARQPADGLRFPGDFIESPRPGVRRRGLRPHRDRRPPRGNRARPAAETVEKKGPAGDA